MPLSKSTANDEQSSVKERLLKYIETKHLNASQFLDMTGLSKTYISNMRQGIKPSTFDNNIAPAFPDLNKAWLLYGEGEMEYIKNSETEEGDFSSLPIEEKLNKIYKFVQESEKILNDRIGDLEEKLRLSQLINRTYLRSIITHSKIKSEEINNAENIEQSIDKKNRA